jgi:hypothetical protein
LLIALLMLIGDWEEGRRKREEGRRKKVNN